ncbi:MULTISPECIES: hypothetical protein [unclassified Mycobacterium]|uniref:hypothetical protein n=1 Tax=unclassified Mycobacterium TaxID=2642494 RepID=UPI0012E9B09C|nr:MULTISPECIES: hypothetical protein [unclassified Mycobacterium]
MKLEERALTDVAIEALGNSLSAEQGSPARCLRFSNGSGVGADRWQRNESGLVRRAGGVRKLFVDSLICIVLVLVCALLLAATFGKLDWFNTTAGSTCLHHHSQSADSFVQLRPRESSLPSTPNSNEGV